MNNSKTDPQTEYTTRLAARRVQAAAHFARFQKIGWWRIFFLLLGALVLLRGLMADAHTLLWALVPLGIISLALLAWHQQIFQARRKSERAVKFYERGLARLAGNWEGGGETGDRFRSEAHPYAQDIDLFGRGSLFELLCTARTRAGEDILAAWVSVPATPVEILARQQAIAALNMNLDLREDLALLGEDLRAGLHPEALARWGKNKALTHLRPLRILTACLCGAAVVALLLLFAGQGALPLYSVLVINALAGWWLRPRINEIIRQAEPAAHDLQLLSEVLARLEQENFTTEKLIQLRTSLETAGRSPSRQIANLHQLLSWLDVRMNQLFRPLSAPFFFVSQFALAVEAWRVNSGALVERWIAAIGEIEALLAFANYAYEHPADVFAEIVTDKIIYQGEALGHPLLPENKVVRTDLYLSNELRLLVVSGSNMSGKSTLLRTVGTNAVLALAGAPVRAVRLQISPLQLGASIRIQDNLRAGASLFYAEITRLRQLMEMTKARLPLLFIIDEILHGTNSHDRRIGSEAVLRGLVERGAMGLVTTHDLALTNIVNDLKPLAKNVHFEDHLENGKMTFDYLLREGVVQKSNALELMRSVGLEV